MTQEKNVFKQFWKFWKLTFLWYFFVFSFFIFVFATIHPIRPINLVFGMEAHYDIERAEKSVFENFNFWRFYGHFLLISSQVKYCDL